MKKIFLAFGAALLLASCTTVTKTATTMDVNNHLTSESDVDLVVSNSKITYTHKTTAKERRGGRKNITNTAVREALEANGNAEVLVAPQYTFVRKSGLFGSKIKTVIVSGYPAKYNNFKSK